MPLILPGQEVRFNEPGRTFDRHHHLTAYAALLVSGSCDEAGDSGRFRLQPGDVLLHRPFDGHADRIGARGAVFLNVPIRIGVNATFGRLADLDAVQQAFERDPIEGEAVFWSEFRDAECGLADWPDLLARDVVRNPRLRLDQWAEMHRVHPASLSRGFRRAYGVTPKRYRFEQSAARAARLIRHSAYSLAAIAAETAFADQAHMTRALTSLFGVTPQALRVFS